MNWLMTLLRDRKPNRCPRGRPHRPQAPRFRSRVETLETRTLLSSYYAASASDLIADIKAANKASGTNTITLTAPATSPYVLTAVNNTTNGANGLPVIASNKGEKLTIIGNGDTIGRSTAAGTPAFRLFDVAAGSSLTLQDLTLQDGLAQGAGAAADGGAIYNEGTLTLTGATAQDNTAQGKSGVNGGFTSKQTKGQTLDGQAGGDAAGGGIWSSGSVTLQGGTTLQWNQARGGNGGAAGNVGNTYGNGGAGGRGLGGGLYEAGGTVTAGDATLFGNDAWGGAGGGLQTRPTIAFIPPLTNTTGIGGRGSGGGLYVAGGTLAMSSTVTVQSNGATGGDGGSFYFYAAIAEPGGEGSGGGIYVADGTVTLDAVGLSGNGVFGGYPGSDYDGFSNPDYANGGNGLGGGLYVGGGVVTLTGDMLTGNEAWGGGGNSYVLSAGSPGLGEGGSIYTSGGTVTISNSCTLSGNEATDDGGGIFINAGTVAVGNSTLSGNNAIYGGGIFVYGGTVTVNSCTLDGNIVFAPGSGGAIDNNAGASALTVSNSVFSNNYVYYYDTPDNIFGPYTDGGGNSFS